MVENNQIEIDRLPGQVLIRLPRRELGALSKSGWLLIGLGTIGILFMIGWISVPLSWAIDAFRQKEWIFGLGLTAFSSTGLIGLHHIKNIFIAGVGIVADRTSTTIQWKPNELVVLEHLAWFRWKRKCKLEKIGRLVFEKQKEKPNERVNN